MSIPNTAAAMRSGIVGTIAHVGPTRVDTAILKYTLDPVTAQNFATPSRGCSVAADGTVYPGQADSDTFAGLLVGNQRIVNNTGDSWHATGDQVELMQMGEMWVNIDNSTGAPSSAATVGGRVYYGKASGKLFSGADTNANLEIKGAVIVAIDDGSKPTRLARVALNGPQPA